MLLFDFETVIYFKTKSPKIVATICDVGQITHHNWQTNWLCYCFVLSSRQFVQSAWQFVQSAVSCVQSSVSWNFHFSDQKYFVQTQWVPWVPFSGAVESLWTSYFFITSKINPTIPWPIALFGALDFRSSLVFLCVS